jgi:predicted nucleic acid-binding protein
MPSCLASQMSFFNCMGRSSCQVQSTKNSLALEPPPRFGWVLDHRDRIEVRKVETPDEVELNSLQNGEAQVIFLAQQTPNSLLIIDEREGRAEARRRGIAVTGLLGVIRDGAIRGYLDFERTLKHLKETDFRLSDEIEAIVREQYRNSQAGD